MASPKTRKFVRITAVIACISAAASLSVLASTPADADPVITAASAYAVNVPSSVLAAAASGANLTGVTDGQYGGMLANSAKFDSDWITSSVGQTMGGTTTITPPDPDTLSPTDLAYLDSLEAQFAGAPAIGAADAALGSVAVITGGVLSFNIGVEAERAMGVDIDGGCAKTRMAKAQSLKL